MKTKFDTAHNPPAPIGSVAIRNTENGERTEEFRMFLDTGADATLIPASRVNDTASVETYDLISFDGTRKPFRAVDAQLVFLGKRFAGKFFLLDDEVGILGRDILNEFSIIFDGPNLEWDIIEHSIDSNDAS